MVYQQTVSIFSTTWWTCILFAITFIIVCLKFPAYSAWGRNKNYTKFIGALILVNLIVENIYGLYLGVWNIKQFLPLHFCGISGLLASTLMFSYSNKIANILFYWGLIGGFYALITPEFDFGADGYFFYSYIIGHASIIFVSLYSILFMGFTPAKNSWLKIFILTQFAVLIIGLINWILGSNYMYLSAPPIAQNPMIIGKWPWYLFVFEFLALAHFFILYSIFHKIKYHKYLFEKKASNRSPNW
jgi:hypothetical integral membrane protein (TIGR02206 family)